MSLPVELNVDLRQMILALETTVSLVGMNDTNHGKRVGYIASHIGRHMGFSDMDAQYLFELGLIHDCGVSTEQMHSNLVNHFDWEDAHIHCEVGHQLLKDFKPLAKFAVPILFHHTPWNQLADVDISANESRMANLIFLADRIDVMGAAHYKSDILLARDEIVRSLDEYAGSYFNPYFVEAFHEVQKCEAFWIALEDRHITRYAWDMGLVESRENLSLSEIRQLSLILAYVVDQKSPFTAEHSVRVGDLSRYLAAIYGLSSEQCEKIEIAGLLHDLGKLHTPDKVLDKPGPLDKIERSIMNQHSYETYEILQHIKGLGEIATWAAYHHEGINGAGYPFHPKPCDLSTEARIIGVVDVFQALVQNRPYRNSMPLPKVLKIIGDLADNGKLDKEIVDLCCKHADDCYRIARGKDKVHNRSRIEVHKAA